MVRRKLRSGRGEDDEDGSWGRRKRRRCGSVDACDVSSSPSLLVYCLGSDEKRYRKSDSSSAIDFSKLAGVVVTLVFGTGREKFGTRSCRDALHTTTVPDEDQT
jgi:hypothetical protein